MLINRYIPGTQMCTYSCTLKKWNSKHSEFWLIKHTSIVTYPGQTCKYLWPHEIKWSSSVRLRIIKILKRDNMSQKLNSEQDMCGNNTIGNCTGIRV